MKRISFVILAIIAMPSPTFAYDGWGNIGLVDGGIWIAHPYLRNAPRLHLSRGFSPCGASVDDRACIDGPAGHGTMVAGVMVADDNPAGMFSTCPECSLIVGRFNNYVTGGAIGASVDSQEVADAARWVAREGAQVLNFSFAAARVGQAYSCADIPAPPLCGAMDFAQQRDIVIVAAVGNNNNQQADDLPFPASDARLAMVPVLGVVRVADVPALNQSPLNPGSPWQRWDETNFPPEFFDNLAGCPLAYPGAECGSNYTSGVVSSFLAAPARDVLTTFIPGLAYVHGWCSDGAAYGTGFDTCRGTSFATPLVSAVFAAVRSANPLMPIADAKYAVVQGASEFVRGATDRGGWGVPDIGKSVQFAYGQWSAGGMSRMIVNRAIPLFGMTTTSTTGSVDTLHTAVPQVAAAAAAGELHAADPVTPGPVYLSRSSFAAVAGYTAFPSYSPTDSARAPRANMFVFAGRANPYGPVQPFQGLFRMSAETRCTDGKLVHMYAVGTAERDQFKNVGLPSGTICQDNASTYAKKIRFVVDGQEGFVLPDCPLGWNCADTASAVAPKCIHRRGNLATGDWTLLLGSQVSNPGYAGYTATIERDCVGYALDNVDSDNDNLPDGLEWILGTNPLLIDSDHDTWLDGQEYPINGAPRSDPANFSSFL